LIIPSLCLFFSLLACSLTEGDMLLMLGASTRRLRKQGLACRLLEEMTDAPSKVTATQVPRSRGMKIKPFSARKVSSYQDVNS